MDVLNQLTDAIRQRNQVEDRIATIVGRPVSAQTLNQFIACRIFQIDLEDPDSDVLHSAGRFRDGPLAGRSVAIQWVAARTRSLDITHDPLPDYVLVVAGSKVPSSSLDGEIRPWLVAAFISDAHQLVAELEGRGFRTGWTTAIDPRVRQAAEIYLRQRSGRYLLSGAQRHALGLFGPEIKFDTPIGGRTTC